MLWFKEVVKESPGLFGSVAHKTLTLHSFLFSCQGWLGIPAEHFKPVWCGSTGAELSLA